MPQGWSWGDDEFARYKTAGIELSREKLLIEGSICRWKLFFSMKFQINGYNQIH